MKLYIALLATASTASAFVAPQPRLPLTHTSTSLDASAIYYSTQTGNTQTCAEYIAAAAGLDSLEDVGDVADSDVLKQDSIIVGAPTWHTDSESERSGTSWDDWLYNNLPNIDMSGKKVAVFGCGDQQSYNEYYCDAAGELYDLFSKAGATMCGFTSTEGYDHSASKAERDGQFIGCMFDEDNQYDMSEDRAKAWVEQLKGEGFF